MVNSAYSARRHSQQNAHQTPHKGHQEAPNRPPRCPMGVARCEHAVTYTDRRRVTHVQSHTHTDTRTHTRTLTHVYTHTHTYTHRHTRTHTHVHSHTYTHTHTHLHTPTHTDTHVHTHTPRITRTHRGGDIGVPLAGRQSTLMTGVAN